MQLNNAKKKVEKSAEKIGISPGEVVLAACTTNPAGTTTGLMAKQLGGVVGGAIAARKSGGGIESVAGDADRFPVGQHYLVLTNLRLLTTTVAAMSGKPKELVADWPLSAVADIDVQPGKMALPMTITFRDGSEARIEGAKGTGANTLPEAFTSAGESQAA